MSIHTLYLHVVFFEDYHLEKLEVVQDRMVAEAPEIEQLCWNSLSPVSTNPRQLNYTLRHGDTNVVGMMPAQVTEMLTVRICDWLSLLPPDLRRVAMVSASIDDERGQHWSITRQPDLHVKEEARRATTPDVPETGVRQIPW